MTLAELIEKLRDLHAIHSSKSVVVFRSDNTTDSEPIFMVRTEEAYETATGKKTIAVIIGE